MSPIPQGDFLNCVVLARVEVEPADLLAWAKARERAAGREPASSRVGPRPLDVDLLLWEGRRQDDPALTLPHPRLIERGFALSPLADLAPAWTVPGTDATVAELLRRLPRDPTLRRVPWNRPGELG